MNQPWPNSMIRWSYFVLISASLQAVYFTNSTTTSSSSSLLHLPHHTPNILSNHPHQPSPTHNSSSSSSSSTSSDIHLRHMTFVAGVPRPVRCVGVGGYPPPRLYVYLGDEDVTDRSFHMAALGCDARSARTAADDVPVGEDDRRVRRATEGWRTTDALPSNGGWLQLTVRQDGCSRTL